ncbi:MAG: thioredoxin domain-containing protein [Blastocatellia bacterium]
MKERKTNINHLSSESSPYLRQHSQNPVEWYPWSDEAFERAKKEDKPILVSLGYSACHWCHVMAHESFEDPEVAAIMNEYFVNIKVDIEERPDVDQIYMNFVQITTGRGGWPLNVFLTPEKIPFFGGTYFPPSPRYGMPSWKQVLLGIADAWRNRREELLSSAIEMLGELRRLSLTEPSGIPIEESLSESAFFALSRAFDRGHGGFGGAPKFPPSMALEFLLRYWKRTGTDEALKIVRKTADEMAAGGIYDQLGGGFHRYAVDAIWLVPHFEKMLYDNAQLARLYLHLFQATKETFYRRIVSETLDYVLREMTSSEGGFFSSQDADSEGEEGKFFVWSPAEIEEALGKVAADRVIKFYGVTKEGNFEGKNILHISDKASLYNDLDSVLAASRRRLFDYRERRIKPFRDEKILTSWNGLMLAAMAEAGAAVGTNSYLSAAIRNAEFLLGRHVFRSDSDPHLQIFRTLKGTGEPIQGFLDDYVNFADGLIELYQATGETKYLLVAREIAESILARFWDAENGGFFYTSIDSEPLIIRNKDLVDNATPSGNSAAADVLLRLAKFFGEDHYERYAIAALRAVANQIERFPAGFGRALSAVEFMFAKVYEIVLTGGEGNDLETVIRREYLPFKVLAPVRSGSLEEIPLTKGRPIVDAKPTAYICENFTCQRPVNSVDEVLELLR